MIYKGDTLIKTIYKGTTMCLAVYNGNTLLHPGGNGAQCSLSYCSRSAPLQTSNGGTWVDGSNHTHPNYNYASDRFYQGNGLWTSGPASNGALYFNNSSGSSKYVVVIGAFRFYSPFTGSLPVQSATSNSLPGMGSVNQITTNNLGVTAGINYLTFSNAIQVNTGFALYPFLLGIVNSEMTISDICITVI